MNSLLKATDSHCPHAHITASLLLQGKYNTQFNEKPIVLFLRQLVKALQELARRFTRHGLSLQGQNSSRTCIQYSQETLQTFRESSHKSSTWSHDLQKTGLKFFRQMTCFHLELHLLINILPKGPWKLSTPFKRHPRILAHCSVFLSL